MQESFHKKIFLAILCIVLLLGCQSFADLKEINNIVIVTATGLDLDKQGKIEVTTQLLLPQSSSINGQINSQVNTSAILSGSGHTISEAVNNIEKKCSRQLFRSHNRVIIISRKLAQSHMSEILDYLMRFREFRERSLLFITDKPVSNVLQYYPFLEQNSGELLSKFTKKDGNLSTTVLDAVIQNVSPGKPLMIPMITISPSNNRIQKNTLSITQAAIFSNNKRVGMMSHDLSYGPQILKNTFWQTVYSIKLDHGMVGLNIQNVKAQMKPSIRNGEWSITAHVTGEGIVFENSSNQALIDRTVQKKIEHSVEKKINMTIKESAKKSQNLKSDVFDFYSTFYRTYPKECLQVKDHWNDTFSQIKLNVSTTFHITHVGINQ
ncbi:Ger(x)C family spore germination protein [Sporolactobacillus sp. STCC-11]|uniref:Ger(x)C family spore germination protein n=1 Tax=Sporolactobacillus caesalpiniae TaxID=3230362 RepID=UPI003392A468